MLQPARRKFRKEQKGRNTGVATRGNTVAFGDFGLKSTDRGRLTARQIESARRAISRHVKRGGRIWIRVFPDKPISTKPAEVRMGNGKGNPEYYVAEIQPGKVLYEIVGVVLAGLANDLAIKLVLDTTLNEHRDRLGTLVADHLANQGALEGCFSFRHGHSLLGRLLFSKDGLGTCDIAAGGAQRVGVTQLLRSLLHAQAEVGLLQ